MPPIDTSAWEGHTFPPDVQRYLTSKLLEGSPLADSLSPLNTSSGRVVFPLVSPEGAAFVGEAQEFPSIDVNDETDIVAAAKLGALVELSNESVDDAVFNLADALGRAIGDSCGPVIDRSFLYGDSALEPAGIVAKAPAAGEGADLREAALIAWGELGAAGARVASIVVYANPVNLAAEWSRTTDQGAPIHGDSPGDVALTLGPGVTVLPIPTMKPEHVLAVDRAAVFRVTRSAVTFEGSGVPGWNRDTYSVRVKGRLAIAAPTPEKSLRLCTITGAAAAAAGGPGAAKAKGATAGV